MATPVSSAMRSSRRDVRDILDENGTNALIAYLLGEAGDILCGRLRLGAEPLRCEEGQPVIATEILGTRRGK